MAAELFMKKVRILYCLNVYYRMDLITINVDNSVDSTFKNPSE